MKRFRLEISGLVQGIGFRPHVCRLAQRYGVAGFVQNSRGGLSLEVEGFDTDVKLFLQNLRGEAPAAAHIDSWHCEEMTPMGAREFRIRESDLNPGGGAAMPKDRAPCEHCMDEFWDPTNRRFLYPFITCDSCGPRFTIADELPFDRERTCMSVFTLCEICQREYEDPKDRRFHAQTISCRDCGPQLSLRGANEKEVLGTDALTAANELLDNGGLLVVKGIGGYQFVCRADNTQSIARIRQFKRRPKKPLALMATNIAQIRDWCKLSSFEIEQLRSPAAPIVVLEQDLGRRSAKSKGIAETLAPSLGTLGWMLPPTPFHHFLMRERNVPLVVTSANLPGEPMIGKEEEALKLAQWLDGTVLTHNRGIVHIADDSVLKCTDMDRIIIRLGRGLAPTEIGRVSGDDQDIILGVGGHLKSAFAIGVGPRFILSQHIGDLDNPAALSLLRQEVQFFTEIYGKKGQQERLGLDAHPSYGSRPLAEELGWPKVNVFHHEAHLAGLLAEKGASGRVLGVVADGSGLGRDGDIWGGEFFLADSSQMERVGSILPFPLLGGEKAVREPRRSAFGMLTVAKEMDWDIQPFVVKHFSAWERDWIKNSLTVRAQCPMTSSLGRVFDAVAALLGLNLKSGYEAEAAMQLEDRARLGLAQDPQPLPMEVVWRQEPDGLWRWDWRNIVHWLVKTEWDSRTLASASAKFHRTVTEVIRQMAQRFQVSTVAASGGVFQNAVLVQMLRRVLNEDSISLLIHDDIPPGDGGLALGQVAWLTTFSNVSASAVVENIITEAVDEEGSCV